MCWKSCGCLRNSVSAKKKRECERVCRASNILFFKLKKKKNQPNLEQARTRASANECLSERKVEKAQKTATISQSRKRQSVKNGTERSREERSCALRERQTSTWRENVILWRHRKRVRTRAREICVLVRDDKNRSKRVVLTRNFRTIFWPFIYLIFGLQSEEGWTEKNAARTYQNFLVNFLANLFSNNFYTSVEPGGVFKPSEQYKQN